MNKSLVLAIALSAIFITTSVASAHEDVQDLITSEPITIMYAAAETAVAGQDITIRYTASSTMPMPPRPPRPPALPQIRETNRRLIERMRSAEELRARPFPTGTTSAGVRMMPVAPADRMMFIMGSSTEPRGFMVRRIAASSSNAIFLREDASTTAGYGGWHMGRFDLPMIRGQLSTSSTGDRMYTITFPPKPPLEKFMDRVLNIFKIRQGMQPRPPIEEIEVIQ